MAARRAGTPWGSMAERSPLSSRVSTWRISLAQVEKGKWTASTALVAKSYSERGGRRLRNRHGGRLLGWG